MSQNFIKNKILYSSHNSIKTFKKFTKYLKNTDKWIKSIYKHLKITRDTLKILINTLKNSTMSETKFYCSHKFYKNFLKIYKMLKKHINK